MKFKIVKRINRIESDLTDEEKEIYQIRIDDTNKSNFGRVDY